jgi:hypothetical protein
VTAVLSLILERVLFHLLIVPGIGIAGSWAVGWNWWVFVAIDAAVSVGYEVARVGVAGVAIGVKDVIPVLLLLKVGVPAPSLAGLVTSAAIVAPIAAVLVVFAFRSRRMPLDRSGHHNWRRPMFAIAALFAAVMIGLFAAGVALVAPAAGMLVALAAIPPGVLAYALQTSPRRGGSRTRAVLTRVRDNPGRIALAGGVRP